MICPNCQEEVYSKKKVCPYCGEELNKDREEDVEFDNLFDNLDGGED